MRVTRRGGVATVRALLLAAGAAAIVAGTLRGSSAAPPPGLSGTYLVTEYFPVPERWFVGRPVAAEGLPGRYRQDFLYSPRGVSMEFDGVTRSGERIHLANDEGITWVNRNGYATLPRPDGRWSDGAPAWRDVGWRNGDGRPTFHRLRGGWSNGRGVRLERSPMRFAPGPSERFLRYWHTAAVDPRVIPLGSRIYVPRFRNAPNRGWFVAQDTGSTIIGHQIDLYVPPPARSDSDLQFSGRIPVRVIPPA
jgi:3D (Asp-Asp-Asp) domain-containing protein